MGGERNIREEPRSRWGEEMSHEREQREARAMKGGREIRLGGDENFKGEQSEEKKLPIALEPMHPPQSNHPASGPHELQH